MSRRRWQDLSDRRRFVILTLGSIQLSLAATAWADLATRPAEQAALTPGLGQLPFGRCWAGC